MAFREMMHYKVYRNSQQLHGRGGLADSNVAAATTCPMRSSGEWLAFWVMHIRKTFPVSAVRHPVLCWTQGQERGAPVFLDPRTAVAQSSERDMLNVFGY